MLTIFSKCSILDTWLGSEYGSVFCLELYIHGLYKLICNTTHGLFRSTYSCLRTKTNNIQDRDVICQTSMVSDFWK